MQKYKKNFNFIQKIKKNWTLALILLVFIYGSLCYYGKHKLLEV